MKPTAPEEGTRYQETCVVDLRAGSPFVSVIILNWNGWQDTVRCLESLLASDQAAFRVVLIDNGSTDGSLEHIEKWAATRIATTAYGRSQAIVGGVEIEEARLAELPRSRVLIHNESNSGFGAGNNIGLSYALARGFDAMWVLNNDTVADVDCLSSMLRELHGGPHVGAVGCVVYQMDGSDAVQLWGGAHVDMTLGIAPHIMGPSAIHRLNMLSGVSVLLRAEALREVGVFDESFFMYWEDSDLSFRLRSAGWKLCVAADARIWHRESSSLGGKETATRDHYYNESLRAFFKKHSWLPIAPICLGLAARKTRRMLAAVQGMHGGQHD
jgi:GT2 family glycosyltransferase